MAFRLNNGLGLGPGLGTVISEDRCKPDHEAQAASLKARLDSTVALSNALAGFAEKNGAYQFENISSFAEMVGGVLMMEREQTKAYESLLKQIEKEA